jgi:hypothetical protein
MEGLSFRNLVLYANRFNTPLNCFPVKLVFGTEASVPYLRFKPYKFQNGSPGILELVYRKKIFQIGVDHSVIDMLNPVTVTLESAAGTVDQYEIGPEYPPGPPPTPSSPPPAAAARPVPPPEPALRVGAIDLEPTAPPPPTAPAKPTPTRTTRPKAAPAPIPPVPPIPPAPPAPAPAAVSADDDEPFALMAPSINAAEDDSLVRAAARDAAARSRKQKSNNAQVLTDYEADPPEPTAPAPEPAASGSEPPARAYNSEPEVITQDMMGKKMRELMDKI